MTEPLVSIVIPCYNHGEFVVDTIKSVISQDYCNIELIIIDDGSQDESVSRISEMISECESRFGRFEFRSRPNKGLCSTLNEALEWCEGEFFSVVASDDVLMPRKTQVQVNRLCELGEGYAGVFGGAIKIDNNGRFVGKLNAGNSSTYGFSDIYFHRHNLPACTQMLRMKYVREVGGYSSKYKIEDWYMWLKLTSTGGRLASIPENLSGYRIHSANTSSNILLMHKERLNIINSGEWLVNAKEKKLAISTCYLSTALQEKRFFSKVGFILKSICVSAAVLKERKFYIAVGRAIV